MKKKPEVPSTVEEMWNIYRDRFPPDVWETPWFLHIKRGFYSGATGMFTLLAKVLSGGISPDLQLHVLLRDLLVELQTYTNSLQEGTEATPKTRAVHDENCDSMDRDPSRPDLIKPCNCGSR